MKLIPLIVVCLGLVTLAHAAPVLDRHPMVCDLTDGGLISVEGTICPNVELWDCYPDGYRNVDIIQMRYCRTGSGWLTPEQYHQSLLPQDGGVSGTGPADGGHDVRGTSIIPTREYDPFHGAPRGVR